jgi:potassium/chloride transporter 4/5/6
MLGAPRTLQALATDHLAPRHLAKVGGKSQQPVVGLTVSMAIALGAVLLGDLNTVAPVVTMFFLTVYATMNIVAALETLSGDPSWRPRIRIPWYVSLIGGLGCLAAMFLINPLVAGLAILVEIAIWLALARKQHTEMWGDARRGLYEAMFRWVLLRLARRPIASRNWRPHVLVFTDDPERRLDLVRFGSWFSQGRGVVTVCELVVGDLLEADLDLGGRRLELQGVLDREGIVAFAEVDVVRDLVHGITDVTQANGMAGMESNTVLLGWPKDPVRLAEFLRTLRRLEPLGKSMVIGRIEPRYLFPREGIKRTIDVWWGGLERNGDLMLLLAHLLKNNMEWRGVDVRVLSVASNELTQQRAEQNLAELIPAVRIDARAEVIVKPDDLTVGEVIRRESGDSDVVFLGLATPDEGGEEEYAERLVNLSEGLTTVFFVRNNSPFGGKLV